MKWAQRQKSCRYIENCVKMELQKSRNRYAWVLRGDTLWFTSAKIISHACTIMQFSNMKPCTLTHWNKNWRYLNKKPTTSLIFRYPLIMLLWLWFLFQWHPALLTPDSCLLFFLSTFLPGTMPHTQHWAPRILPHHLDTAPSSQSLATVLRGYVAVMTSRSYMG